MQVGKVLISGNEIRVLDHRPVTAGLIGATVELQFASDWEELNKVLVWTGSGITIDDMDATGIVPAEVLIEPGTRLLLGVYGTGADRCVPTIWADLGKILPGADPSGEYAAEEPRSLYNEMRQTTDEVQQKLDSGAFIGPPGTPGDRGPMGYGSQVEETVQLPYANDILLDAHLTRMVNATAVGVQRYVQIHVPADGCALPAGAWLVRIWRQSESKTLVEAVHEDGNRLTRTLNGHAAAVLPGAPTDGWSIEAEKPGSAVPDGTPAALIAGGRMQIRADGLYTYMALNEPGSDTWSNYTVEADMTYVDDTYYAGLVYNGTSAKLHQKAGIYRNGTATPRFFLNGRQDKTGAAMWLNNGSENHTTATNCSALTYGQKFRLKVETWNMDGVTTGSARLSTAFYDINGTLGEWTVQAEVSNIDASTWKGTVGILISGEMTLDVDNITVTKDGATLYSEDFSAYSGAWDEWLWDNPPMGNLGTIYATTQTYNGKRVYFAELLANESLQKGTMWNYYSALGYHEAVRQERYTVDHNGFRVSLPQEGIACYDSHDPMDYASGYKVVCDSSMAGRPLYARVWFIRFTYDEIFVT